MAIGDGGKLKWGQYHKGTLNICILMIFIDINNQWRFLSYPSDEITRQKMGIQ